MITVIDIGLGNVRSVSNALHFLRVDHLVTGDCGAMRNADRLIFPGVGSFSEASTRLFQTGVGQCVQEMVLSKRKPILGICLGMQLLAKEGEEGGISRGLGLIDARVLKLQVPASGCRLPHIGWNDITNNGMTILKGIEDGTCFYFVHSYAMVVNEPCARATCEYGASFNAAVQKGHICGTQFHPEKSRESGLQVLRNFIAEQF